MSCNYDPTNIVLETYNYDVRFEKEESADITKGGEECAKFTTHEEEVKEEKGLKILTPNKLLTSLPVLLAQIKAV